MEMQIQKECLIVTDHHNQLDTTISACLDIKLNSNCTGCRKYKPCCDIKGTRKVTSGSELAPAAGSTFPSSSSSTSHSYGTHQASRFQEYMNYYVLNL